MVALAIEDTGTVILYLGVY